MTWSARRLSRAPARSAALTSAPSASPPSSAAMTSAAPALRQKVPQSFRNQHIEAFVPMLQHVPAPLGCCSYFRRCK